MTNKSLSRFLLECPHAVSTNLYNANQLGNSSDTSNVDAQILALVEHAQKCINSPLVRKCAAYPRFAIGKSTFAKKVKARELPQPVYCNSRVTAYRVIDLDMTLAALALAAQHGFMLNMKAFVAALSRPVGASAEISA